MKVWGVAMMRNEGDLAEAFVRHALTVFDGLVVADHASSDATPRILAALRAERLPLVVKRAEHVGYLQAEIMSALAREAFALAHADVVLPLDADEFARIPSRERFEAAMRALPDGHVGLASWPTFVPPFDGADDILARLRAARRVAKPEGHGTTSAYKVVLGTAYARAPEANLTMGNHGAMLGNDQRTAPRMPATVLDADVVEVRHVPVRSQRQFVVKTVVKRLARVAAGRDYAPGSPMRRAFDLVRHGEPLTPISMLAGHLDIEDPAIAASLMAPTPPRPDDRVVADVALRYTAREPADPFPIVLAAVQGIVRRAAQVRATAPRR